MASGPEDANARIEDLLARLGGLPDRRALEWAEELVRVVSDLYGEGLARVLFAAGPGPARELAGDVLVGPLMVLHGLHPEGLARRAQQALDGLSPLLGVEDARVVEADDRTGRVRVRLLLLPGRMSQRARMESLVRETLEQGVPDAGEIVVDCPDTGSPVRFLTRAGP